MSFFWTRRRIAMDYISSSDSEDEYQVAIRTRFSHDLFLQFMHNMTPAYLERKSLDDELASKRLEEQRQQDLQTGAREQEKANKKAAELLQSEEMLQRKREKNRQKKLKKKKAKQEAKKHLNTASQGNPVPGDEISAEEDIEEEESASKYETETSLNEEIDPNSAFAAKSMQKANVKPESANSAKQAQPMDKFKILRRLATSTINEGFFKEAISILNQAIAIYSKDGKIYLERAECFFKLGKFEEALQDALANVERNPRSSQGYKLACKAYLSLKQYDKAHEAIMKAKEIEGYTEDVQGGIKRVGVLKLTDMGFDEDKAVSAMEKKLNFQDALDELLGGLEQLKLAKSTEVEEWDWSEDQEDNAVGYTPLDAVNTTKVDEWGDWSKDREENADVSTTKAVALPSISVLEQQDRSVSDNSRSVWVGSVSPNATWNDLNMLFLTCGTIHTLYKPVNTNFAFVNFTTSSEACQAIAKFNNYEFFGEKLVVRVANSSQKPYKTSLVPKPPTPKKIDPRNPLGIKSLYVANVMPKMNEKELHNIFSSCGHVTSCQILREKKCAFVNYTTSYEATKALETLQNFRYKNMCLVLKFPKNTEHTVIGKKKPNIPLFAIPEPSVQEVISVPSGECEFWRKGECVFGGNCWLAHVPEHQGVDATMN